MPWWLLAILGALCAGAVSVLAKLGFGKDANLISANLATAVRMLVVFPLAWALVGMEGSLGQLHRITSRQWVVLLLSGLATGLSWIFYFLALSKGEVNRVNPIDKSSIAVSFVLVLLLVPGETFKWQTATATVLVLAALFVTLIKSPTPASTLPVSTISTPSASVSVSASAPATTAGVSPASEPEPHEPMPK
jgi:transporter family protein